MPGAKKKISEAKKARQASSKLDKPLHNIEDTSEKAETYHEVKKETLPQ